MSFILDALKKSEIERQRQSLPGLMDTPAARRRNRLPLWALLLAILLAVNIAVLVVILVHNGSAPAANIKKRANTAPVAEEQAPAVTEHFSPLGQAPVYAPEIPVTSADRAAGGPDPVPAVAPLVPSRPLAQRSAPHASAHRPDPVLSDEDARADEEVLPTINEINLTGSQALPELHLDVHVFATKPADRFVYINMRKYHEGNTLPEGPLVEHIRRDGVVLNYQGLRFILPRQS
jgi:general secretion pathway protein B